MAELLEVEGLSVGYFPGQGVLHGVSLKVQQGTITTVVGPNGAGKTTLLHTIYGFLPLWQGEVRFRGQPLRPGPRMPFELPAMGISYLPQDSSLFAQLSVEDNLRLAALGNRSGGEVDIGQKLARVFEYFPDLEAKRHVRASYLSGGQQKMLEVGKVLMQAPKLLLVDEPTTGLAPMLASLIYRSLRGLKEAGTTVLLVDQNLRQAVEIADYVYIMDLGRVVQHGPQAEFSQRLHDVVRSWFRVGEKGASP